MKPYLTDIEVNYCDEFPEDEKNSETFVSDSSVIDKYQFVITNNHIVDEAISQYIQQYDYSYYKIDDNKQIVYKLILSIKESDEWIALDNKYKIKQRKGFKDEDVTELAVFTDPLQNIPEKSFILFKLNQWWMPAFVAIVEEDDMDLIVYNHGETAVRFITYSKLTKVRNFDSRIKVMTVSN